MAQWLNKLDTEIRAITSKPMPIYVSEIGWPNHTGTGGSSEALSAQRLLKTLLLLAARDTVRAVSWYDLFDDGADPTEKEHHFGLIRTDGSRKPAFSAYQFFLGHFKGAQFVKNLAAGAPGVLE